MVSLINPKIVQDPSAYMEFFARVGQGGVRLTDDELTYSMIKYKYPPMRPRINDIIKNREQGATGRLLGEVDLALSSLRAAQALSSDTDKGERSISRPNPTTVEKIDFDKDIRPVPFFKTLMPEDCPGRLFTSLRAMRKQLEFDPAKNPDGLPNMLFARLDRGLIDVLVLWGSQRDYDSWNEEEVNLLRSFILYWIVFVTKTDKAAQETIDISLRSDWGIRAKRLAAIARKLEYDGLAYPVPTAREITTLTERCETREPFRAWVERFTFEQGSDHRQVKSDRSRYLTEFLRYWSSHSGAGRKIATHALIWLQRLYLRKVDKYYDPTSDRDEDLPVDLDHLVAHAHWGFHANAAVNIAPEISKLFFANRYLVGNSIGNLQFLKMEHNRAIGKSTKETTDVSAYVLDLSRWNKVSKKKDESERDWDIERWSEFQCLVELRALILLDTYLKTSGVWNNCSVRSPVRGGALAGNQHWLHPDPGARHPLQPSQP